MPKDVQYIGGADKATITDEQFTKAGVNNDTVVWTGRGSIRSVNNDAADHLVKNEPKRFAEPGTVEAKEDDAPPPEGSDTEEDTTSGATDSSGEGTKSKTSGSKSS